MEQNLSTYHIFNTVAKVGNISHAAKELYISQPAISKAISKLEESLNIKLFHRTSRGVHLTKEGLILYESTKSAFHALSLGEENIRKINQLGIGHLRIGVSTTLCKYILLPYLKNFVLKYPHIKITIECQSTLKTLDLLEQGKIDVGLIGKPANDKNIDFYTIHTIEDIFVATSSYLDNLILREHKDNIEPTSSIIFKSANIMLLDEKNMSRLYIEDYFTRNNIETHHILEVSNMDLLIEFAKISLGVSCVIKEFVKKELDNKELIEISLTDPLVNREVGFAYNESANLSDSLLKFIEFYKKMPIV